MTGLELFISFDLYGIFTGQHENIFLDSLSFSCYEIHAQCDLHSVFEPAM